MPCYGIPTRYEHPERLPGLFQADGSRWTEYRGIVLLPVEAPQAAGSDL